MLSKYFVSLLSLKSFVLSSSEGSGVVCPMRRAMI
jgi:hypothetical protein